MMIEGISFDGDDKNQLSRLVGDAMMSWQTPLKEKVVLFIRIVAGWDRAAYEKRKGDRTSQDREFKGSSADQLLPEASRDFLLCMQLKVHETTSFCVSDRHARRPAAFICNGHRLSYLWYSIHERWYVAVCISCMHEFHGRGFAHTGMEAPLAISASRIGRRTEIFRLSRPNSCAIGSIRH